MKLKIVNVTSLTYVVLILGLSVLITSSFFETVDAKTEDVQTIGTSKRYSTGFGTAVETVTPTGPCKVTIDNRSGSGGFIVSCTGIGICTVNYTYIKNGDELPGVLKINQKDKTWLKEWVSINSGDTITWKNNDSIAHSIVSGSVATGPDGHFASGTIEPGHLFSHTFEGISPSSFEIAYVYCSTHNVDLLPMKINLAEDITREIIIDHDEFDHDVLIVEIIDFDNIIPPPEEKEAPDEIIPDNLASGSFIFKNLRLQDSSGNTIKTATIDSPVQITADIINNLGKEQPFAYYVIVKDSSGIVSESLPYFL